MLKKYVTLELTTYDIKVKSRQYYDDSMRWYINQNNSTRRQETQFYKEEAEMLQEQEREICFQSPVLK